MKMNSNSESERKPTFADEKYERMFQEAIKRPGSRMAVWVQGSWNREQSNCRSFLKPKVENEGKPTFADEKYEKMYQEAIKRPGIRMAIRVQGSWKREQSKCRHL